MMRLPTFRKLKNAALITLIISLFGCSKNSQKTYSPYSNLNPTVVQKQLPMNYEESLNYLDVILTDEAKEHFKNQDSTIAVIEISEQIGGFFITNWYLRYFINTESDLNTLMELPPHAPGIARLFTKAGVPHPNAMIRVIFSCYFRKLKGQTYDWNEEINKIKSHWEDDGDPQQLYNTPQKVKRKEWITKSRFYHDRLNQNDSVIIFLNRPPVILGKSPNAYYITGIVNFKIPDNQTINILISEIRSNKGTSQITLKDRLLQTGDTLTGNAIDWHKRDVLYFNYLTNRPYPNSIP